MSVQTKRAIAGVLAATIALTAAAVAPASAAPIGNLQPAAVGMTEDSGVTNVHYRGGYGYHRGNAAALGMFAAIAGTVAAVAAARHYRHRYYAPYGYGGYGGYYGGPGYGYGPRYYPY
jgi:hypothetical protein